MDKLRCDGCDRGFQTREALAMHNSAKHGAPSGKRSGFGLNTIIPVVGVLLVFVVGFMVYGSGFTGKAASSGIGSSQGQGGDVIQVSGADDSPQKVRIGFNGNYYPNTIRVKSGRLVEITLDNSVGGCFRSFNIDAFGVSGYSSSPSDTINFIPDRKGTFEYRCGMGMGRGTIVVE